MKMWWKMDKCNICLARIDDHTEDVSWGWQNDYICAEWERYFPERRRSKEEQGSRPGAFCTLGTYTILWHLSLFFAKARQNVWIVWISRLFPNCREKNYDGKILFEKYFWQTGKKATSVVSEQRSESSSLGPIGADLAWKKVLLHEIDDEEVI